MPVRQPFRRWADLEGKIAPEVFHAPRTAGDLEGKGIWPEVRARIVIYLVNNVLGKPWENHLALLAVVLVARRRDVSTVRSTLVNLHARFCKMFPALHLETIHDWQADLHMSAYLRGEILPEETKAIRLSFWQAYHSSTKQLRTWWNALPEDVRQLYQPFLLPSVHPLSVEGLTERKEVEQQQRQSRKSETDAVVPHLAALRAEAHYRYNRVLRLRQAYLQAVAAIQKESLPLPFHFSYDEGNPPVERLHFRIWDRRSFVFAHPYCKNQYYWAKRGYGTYDEERNGFFLEFVKAERLGSDVPAEGLWFVEPLKMGLFSSKLYCGSKKDVPALVTWLEAWGYAEPGEDRYTSPFWTQISGLLNWSKVNSAFMTRAQEKAEGVLIPVEPLYAGAMFGLLAVDLFTTTGMRANEAMQARLSEDCFVRLIMPAPPGAKDQSPRIRFAFRLIPKGERTETPQNYFIGEETKRLLVKTAKLLAEHYHLQPGEALPTVPFNPEHGRSHRFKEAPYLFQYHRQALSNMAISACMRFLLHGMILQTRDGKRVILKPHLLRHAFATHAVQVEKIPIDIVGEWLKQKCLEVTDYYSQPTESMIAEAVDHYLAGIAVSVNISTSVVRSPEELQRLYHEAAGKAGTLAEVLGGHCISHGYCAAKFVCIGCAGKVPDPAKRIQVARHKTWAMAQVSYAKEEGLLPEAERMKQLARDCETELLEMDQIEAYRKDEARAIQIQPESK